eukprot:gene2210-biopygen11350
MKPFSVPIPMNTFPNNGGNVTVCVDIGEVGIEFVKAEWGWGRDSGETTVGWDRDIGDTEIALSKEGSPNRLSCEGQPAGF